jgi:UTP-glucose-1-phosphate uridylyltransferase
LFTFTQQNATSRAYALATKREKRRVVSHVEVQVELPRVGPEPDPVNFSTFVLDPDIYHILREDIALKQELVIRLETRQLPD